MDLYEQSKISVKAVGLLLKSMPGSVRGPLDFLVLVASKLG
jgi:hypothetical protein